MAERRLGIAESPARCFPDDRDLTQATRRTRGANERTHNDIEPKLFRQYTDVVELETRYELLGQPGATKFLTYRDNGRFAKFRDVLILALATENLPHDVTALQQRHFDWAAE